MIAPEVLKWIDNHRQEQVNELLEFLTIPSVSTCPDHAADMTRAAAWVLEQLEQLGLKARIWPTARHPVVFGESLSAGNCPTLLIYGHYDVQPPEPLDQWLTPPFVPDLRDGYVYARGATDDKGQFFTYLKALEAILNVDQALPLKVKILVEGEEESGSPGMAALLQQHRQELDADVVAISDGSQFARGIPAITYGLRGLCYLQLDLQGPRVDLHSGAFGGLLTNPVQALAGLLTKLTDPQGRVAIPGFYDEVETLQPWERDQMATLPFDEEQLRTGTWSQALPWPNLIESPTRRGKDQARDATRKAPPPAATPQKNGCSTDDRGEKRKDKPGGSFAIPPGPGPWHGIILSLIHI